MVGPDSETTTGCRPEVVILSSLYFRYHATEIPNRSTIATKGRLQPHEHGPDRHPRRGRRGTCPGVTYMERSR